MSTKGRVLTSALRVIGGPTLRSLKSAATRTEGAQRDALLRMLRHNSDTEFGQLHGFSRIHRTEDYRERVPIRDYEEFRPLVQQILDGQPRVLTTDPPLFLARTSGTTGESKLVPVTKPFVTRQKQLTRAWMAAASSAHAGLLDHSALGIVSPAIDSITEGGLPVGSTSGMIYRSTPAVLRRQYAVPEDVFSVADYDTRYFLLARFAAARQLSVIATPNPATLLRLTDVMRDDAERLITAIGDGTIGIEIHAPRSVKDELRRRLRPDPDRAGELIKVVNHAGELSPAHAWPALQLIGCWLGGTSGLQSQRLIERFGRRPFRDLGYLASEGHFTVPIVDGTPGGLLDLTTNFFEFMPEADSCTDEAAVGAHEVEVGCRYRVIVTTIAGLYRYEMNDIVEVVDRYRDSPVIAFVRKAGEMANLTGEKLHANHVIEALDVLQSRGVPMVEAQLAADVDHMRYALSLELEPGHTADTAELAHTVDEALMRVNIEYAEKRHSRRLAPVVINVKPPGWGDETRRRRVLAGGSDAQVKWRYLVGPDDAISS